MHIQKVQVEDNTNRVDAELRFFIYRNNNQNHIKLNKTLIYEIKRIKFLLLFCVHILNKKTDTVDVLTSSTPVGEIGSVKNPQFNIPLLSIMIIGLRDTLY